MVPIITLVCDGCGKSFERISAQHRGNLKRGRKTIACSPGCFNKVQTRPDRLCPICKQLYRPKEKEQKFCGRQCSAVSQKKPKEEKTKNPRKHQGLDYSRVTLQDLKDKYHTLAYHAKIRGLARSVYSQFGKPMVCFNCGYTLHVDVCHVVDVKDFSLDTMVSVVNDINNLVALDKRCHWEFDNGYLKLEL